jgi:hypothetical protein
LIIASSLASGCGRLATMMFCGHETPAGIVASDLIGAYRDSRNGGLVILETETAFAASELEGWEWDAGREMTTSGVGSWGLQPSSDDELVADLSFTEHDGPATDLSLQIAGSRDKPMLWYYSGDPDSCRMHELKRDA